MKRETRGGIIVSGEIEALGGIETLLLIIWNLFAKP